MGKSPSRPRQPTNQPVHPHTCGEIFWLSVSGAGLVGSPPHVWGNLAICNTFVTLIRFTPTRVGKSRHVANVRHPATVHPHTCGEIVSVVVFGVRPPGSPPHVWGNPKAFASNPKGWRFTPTRVGKSLCGNSRQRAATVHPHTCGEISSLWERKVWPLGSPPHVWGNLH